MAATPPTPFILSVEFVLIINPYKILRILFNAVESTQKLEKEIAAISTSPGNYVKVQDEKPVAKPEVKSSVVKPSVKVV
jgi:hypothetical protein